MQHQWLGGSHVEGTLHCFTSASQALYKVNTVLFLELRKWKLREGKQFSGVTQLVSRQRQHADQASLMESPHTHFAQQEVLWVPWTQQALWDEAVPFRRWPPKTRRGPEKEKQFFFSNDTQVTHPFLSLCSKFSCLNLDISDLGTHWSAPQGGCPFVSRHRSVQAAAPPGHLLP